MKVYLANFFSKKAQMKSYAEELKQLGIEVTARWFDETIPHTVTMADLPDKYHEETALIDLYDINRADVLVLFAGTPNDYAQIAVGALARGGRHVELGYAIAQGKHVIICGPRENVFHHLPEIKQFDTWEQVKGHLTHDAIIYRSRSERDRSETGRGEAGRGQDARIPGTYRVLPEGVGSRI